jgi:hypothetical protein
MSKKEKQQAILLKLIEVVLLRISNSREESSPKKNHQTQ